MQRKILYYPGEQLTSSFCLMGKIEKREVRNGLEELRVRKSVCSC